MSFTTQGPYKVGTVVTMTYNWQKKDLTYVDPTTITLKYGLLNQDGTFSNVVTIVSPNASIVKDAVGQYHTDLDTTGMAAGRYGWQARAAGAVVGIEYGEFVLQPAPLG